MKKIILSKLYYQNTVNEIIISDTKFLELVCILVNILYYGCIINKDYELL